jgi:hypothetical protein
MSYLQMLHQLQSLFYVQQTDFFIFFINSFISNQNYFDSIS